MNIRGRERGDKWMMDGWKDGRWMTHAEMDPWVDGGWMDGRRVDGGWMGGRRVDGSMGRWRGDGREDAGMEDGWTHEGQRLDGEATETAFPVLTAL